MIDLLCFNFIRQSSLPFFCKIYFVYPWHFRYNYLRFFRHAESEAECQKLIDFVVSNDGKKKILVCSINKIVIIEYVRIVLV